MRVCHRRFVHNHELGSKISKQALSDLEIPLDQQLGTQYRRRERAFVLCHTSDGMMTWFWRVRSDQIYTLKGGRGSQKATSRLGSRPAPIKVPTHPLVPSSLTEASHLFLRTDSFNKKA